MAISYTTIFTQLGKIIGRLNTYPALASTTLAADLSTLVTAFGTTWQPASPIAAAYTSYQAQVTGWVQGLARYADARLLDNATVLSLLASPLPSMTSLAVLLPALAKQMVLDAQTVKASLCTVSAVSAVAGNIGNGNAYPTLILDGVNPPIVGSVSSQTYEGQSSQLCTPSETMTLECVADSYSNGLAVGAELWRWSGSPQQPQLGWQTEGSGQGPSISTDNGGANAVGNGGFAQWFGNVPSRWSLDSGVAGSSIVQEGTEAKIVGNGVTTVQLSQALTLTPRRRYHVSIQARMSGATTGTVTVGVPGGGASVACSALAATNGPIRAHFNTPAPFSGGVTVSVSGLNAGGSVWISMVAVTPTVYHGGVGVNILPGLVAWQRGDRMTFAVTNDQGGKFQEFFRRRYGAQLPTVKSGVSQGPLLTLLLTMMPWTVTETVADSLVV